MNKIVLFNLIAFTFNLVILVIFVTMNEPVAAAFALTGVIAGAIGATAGWNDAPKS